LSRLDAQTLAAQEMTDQDLKEVEGGLVVIAIILPLFALLLPPQ
jgi:bacteriocin-like protein